MQSFTHNDLMRHLVGKRKGDRIIEIPCDPRMLQCRLGIISLVWLETTKTGKEIKGYVRHFLLLDEFVKLFVAQYFLVLFRLKTILTQNRVLLG